MDDRERLLSHTTDLIGLHDKLDEMEEELDSIKKQVYGYPEARQPGLLHAFIEYKKIVDELYSVVIHDLTGRKGLSADVDFLMGRRHDRSESRKLRWEFWKAISVAIISSGVITYLLANWGQVRALLPKSKPDKVSLMIERAKHPKGKIVYRKRIVPPPPKEPEPEMSPDLP